MQTYHQKLCSEALKMSMDRSYCLETGMYGENIGKSFWCVPIKREPCDPGIPRGVIKTATEWHKILFGDCA